MKENRDEVSRQASVKVLLRQGIKVYMKSCYEYIYDKNVDISHVYWKIHGFNN